MFIQVIQAPAEDADALRAASYRWAHTLGSTSVGWLGCTGGVTAEGTFLTVERFESEQKAILESGRPGRRRWWRDMTAGLGGDATFTNCRTVHVSALDPAGIDHAGYVQIVQGRVRDATMLATLLRTQEKEMALSRPDLLGSTLAFHPDDGYTHLLYFVSEDTVMDAELRETPPRLKAVMDALYELHEAAPAHHLLTDPWMHTRRDTLPATV
ncbi:hypothetical protein [Actinocorallia longicatena]|uniref:NIPSNAP protein n=1 Tax=Actinocorallia longicatena TaxID=111803 RepID=A0ABP6PY18_9ACTN